MKKIFKFKGQTLIELILAMGIAALIFPALLTGFMSSREGKVQETQRMQALTLLKEAEQAVRSVRNNNWNTFAVNGTFYPALSGSVWTLAAGTTVTNGFTEKIDISDVSRNATGDIVTSGGTNDPSTKKVVITISWTQPTNAFVVSTFYLTRTNNLTYTDTTYNQFNAGTKTGVSVAKTGNSPTDGQVQLSAGGGGGDWCSPSFAISVVDLPKSGVANAIYALAGPNTNESTVFAGTGENASGVSFAKVDVPGNPPSPSIAATFDGYKTNAVFGESHYAYLATDNNSKEIVIIDLNQFSDAPNNTKYKEVGSINLPGSVDGWSIFVVNNKAYVTSSDNHFYIYDVTNRTSPVLLNSGGLVVPEQAKKVLVTGNYAYITTENYPLEIIDISNSSSPVIIGKLNLNTGQSGRDIYINTANSNPSRAYVVTTPVSGKNDFYIVDITNKNAPTVNGLSGYSTSDMTPTGLTIVTGNKAIIVGSGGTYQYQVVDISNETGVLTSCGHLSYSTGIRGVSSVLQQDGYAYSYIITGDGGSELKIILGGAGGNFSNNGIFESATYDAGYSTAFNSFSANINQLTFTSIKLQVATAPAVGGSCAGASFTYVGPNGDPAAYFTSVGNVLSGTIPFGNYISNAYQNPGRCFRYKVWMNTTDQTQTPALYDFTANYSP